MMRLASLVGVALVVGVSGWASGADWPDHLRTGKLLDIGLNYSSQKPERLEAFDRMRCRIMLGGGGAAVAGWGYPARDQYDGYRQQGFEYIVYSTPHTIYGDDFFEGSDPHEAIPRSREWLAVGADGQPLRPWGTTEQRYLACVNNPGWREFSRNVMKTIVASGAVGVFWDDAFPFACDCPHCHKAFRAYLAARYTPAEIAAMGVTDAELPPPSSVRPLNMGDCKTQLDRERALFAESSLEGFLGDLEATARALNPSFVCSANTSQPGVTACMLLSQRVMDLWVYEEGPHTLAPQHNNALRYLQGFARAMGKPVEMIACGDGWGQEKATPQQFASSIAEGVACGGEFLLHLGHEGGDDEVWRTNPANVDAVARYRRFFDERQSLLQGLRPAARVAILDSNASALNDSVYLQRLGDLTAQLNYTGIPYTVLNAETSADLLGQFDAVLTSFAQVLSDDEVAALRRYRAGGGTLVCIGPTGTLTDRWQERTDPISPGFGGTPYASDLQPLIAQASAKGPLLEEPDGARVQLHAWEKSDGTGRELVLHLMNYTLPPQPSDASAADTVGAVRGLRLSLPAGMAPTDARWETPGGASQALDVGSDGARCVVSCLTLGLTPW